MTFSPDRQSSQQATMRDTSQLWDMATRRLLGHAMTVGKTVDSIAFSPTGGLVATGSESGTAAMWNAATQQEAGRPLTTRPLVSSVGFSLDGQVLATGSHDGTVRLWEAVTYQQIGLPLSDYYGEGYSVEPLRAGTSRRHRQRGPRSPVER